MEKTIPLGARLKPTTLANLARMLASKAQAPISRADIVRQTSELMEQIAITKGWIVPVTDIQDAIAVLRSMGINVMRNKVAAEAVNDMIREEISFPAKREAEKEQEAVDMLAIARALMKEVREENQ